MDDQPRVLSTARTHLHAQWNDLEGEAVPAESNGEPHGMAHRLTCSQLYLESSAIRINSTQHDYVLEGCGEHYPRSIQWCQDSRWN
jgi:hypothetical protein